MTQRGNNRQDVFFVDDDRRLYLRILAEECQAHGLDVLAYCLMANHVLQKSGDTIQIKSSPRGDEVVLNGATPAARWPTRSPSSTARGVR